MGLFWDLLQQSQISQARDKADSLEMRVARLERELERAWKIIHELVRILEQRFGQDIDRDGRVG